NCSVCCCCKSSSPRTQPEAPAIKRDAAARHDHVAASGRRPGHLAAYVSHGRHPEPATGAFVELRIASGVTNRGFVVRLPSKTLRERGLPALTWSAAHSRSGYS